eukprot:109336-Chlamydomonas_euryale.AAC.1
MNHALDNLFCPLNPSTLPRELETHLLRPPQRRVVSAATLDDVSDEVLLPVVRGQDGDLGRWIPQQAHETKHADHILRLAQVLVKVRGRLGLALRSRGKVWREGVDAGGGMREEGH